MDVFSLSHSAHKQEKQAKWALTPPRCAPSSALFTVKALCKWCDLNLSMNRRYVLQSCFENTTWGPTQTETHTMQLLLTLQTPAHKQTHKHVHLHCKAHHIILTCETSRCNFGIDSEVRAICTWDSSVTGNYTLAPLHERAVHESLHWMYMLATIIQLFSD